MPEAAILNVIALPLKHGKPYQAEIGPTVLHLSSVLPARPRRTWLSLQKEG
jgi:hypothetical protein